MSNNKSDRDKQKQLTETVERQEKVRTWPVTKRFVEVSDQAYLKHFVTYQKHGLVRKAIPNIASAIKTVVSLSNNENFKAECLKLVKVGWQLTNQ